MTFTKRVLATLGLLGLVLTQACSSSSSDSDVDLFLADSSLSVVVSYLDAVNPENGDDQTKTYTASIPTTLPDLIYIEDEETLVIDFLDFITEAEGDDPDEENEYFDFYAFADFSEDVYSSEDDDFGIDFSDVTATYNYGFEDDEFFTQDLFDIADDNIVLTYSISEFTQYRELSECTADADLTCATISLDLTASLRDSNNNIAGTVTISLVDYPVTHKSSN